MGGALGVLARRDAVLYSGFWVEGVVVEFCYIFVLKLRN